MANKRFTYWEVLLRFGLPFVVVYEGLNYLWEHTAQPYHWLRHTLVDIAVAAFVSWLFYKVFPRLRSGHR